MVKLKNISQCKSLMSDNKLLVAPKSKQVTYGDHAFSSAVTRMLNVLPDYIKVSVSIAVFKCHLKTHLCNKSYIDFYNHVYVCSSFITKMWSDF